jgi:serine/threonine protein phosphatase PrpC
MIRVFSRSEAGGHPENEDAFRTLSLSHDPEYHLCAIADGQGGQSGGAAAAQLACDTCLAAVIRNSFEQLLFPGTWLKALAEADKTVAANPAAGFTTLVAFCITNQYICGVSNGDSAVVLLDGGQKTILTARQPKNPPVGSGAAEGAVFGAKVGQEWKVLAITDGVWKYVGWDGVFQVASSAISDDLILSLRDRAKLRGSGGLQDDFTVVLLQDSSI